MLQAVAIARPEAARDRGAADAAAHGLGGAGVDGAGSVGVDGLHYGLGGGLLLLFYRLESATV